MNILKSIHLILIILLITSAKLRNAALRIISQDPYLNVCIVATAGHWTRDTTHVCVEESRSRVGLLGMESCVSAL